MFVFFLSLSQALLLSDASLTQGRSEKRKKRLQQQQHEKRGSASALTSQTVGIPAARVKATSDFGGYFRRRWRWWKSILIGKSTAIKPARYCYYADTMRVARLRHSSSDQANEGPLCPHPFWQECPYSGKAVLALLHRLSRV